MQGTKDHRSRGRVEGTVLESNTNEKAAQTEKKPNQVRKAKGHRCGKVQPSKGDIARKTLAILLK